MRKTILLGMILMLTVTSFGQNEHSTNLNAAESLLKSGSNLSIGGYAQIDFNQPLNKSRRQNSTLDVHRLVLLFGYRFNDKTNFISEIEIEHVEEIYVEQAFLNHKFLPWLNLRGGLMLVPMGIINEYHEPTTFNGVERPNLDNKIVPTTWREIGFGFTGRFDDASLKYQIFVMNGFNGFDGSGKFRGSDSFRKGRQKGAESFMSSPTFATRIDYYGIRGLKLGLSTYNGKSQSTLYDGVERNDNLTLLKADSSSVGISIIGLDARYKNRGIEVRGQFYHTSINNTAKYNKFTGSDLGSGMLGWYLEAGYDVLYGIENGKRLVPFIRYEKYNTHAKTAGTLAKNKTLDRTDVTVGAGWWLTSGTVIKADYQFFSNSLEKTGGQLNLGIGIWF